ncbi:hypothetical protein ACSBOB_20190 [Mesorhizobium sp. ASY16-5R]|uniref:hypothetical protein n=1 Tax=Mesorhizobium sp. ASY16-5R TaxID=3445772 RepID=UPI003FA01F65
MKFLLAASVLAVGLSGSVHAQAYGSGVDGQSVFRVSQTQIVSFVSASTASQKLASETRVIRLSCTQDCHFKRGATSGVTATVSDSLLFAGATEYFKVPATGPNYIGFIRDSADGRAFIDEMTP